MQPWQTPFLTPRSPFVLPLLSLLLSCHNKDAQPVNQLHVPKLVFYRTNHSNHLFLLFTIAHSSCLCSLAFPSHINIFRLSIWSCHVILVGFFKLLFSSLPSFCWCTAVLQHWPRFVRNVLVSSKPVFVWEGNKSCFVLKQLAVA